MNTDDIKPFSDLLPGEKIDFHAGKVGHHMETVSIEGNGLPIKLGHYIEGNQLYFDVPALSGVASRIFSHNPVADCATLVPIWDASFWTNKDDGSKIYFTPRRGEYIFNSDVAFVHGYKKIHFFLNKHISIQRFPASAVYISPSNWYIECVASSNNSNYIEYKVVSPDGIEYFFDTYVDERPDWRSRFNPRTFIRLSTITDKHGNKLVYDYEKYYVRRWDSNAGNSGRYYQEFNNRLKSITATDRRKLDFIYSNSPYRPYVRNYTITLKDNSLTKTVNVTYHYQGNNNRLQSSTVTREDGKTWKYTLQPKNIWGNYVPPSQFELKSVEYPSGLKVTYEYKARGTGLVYYSSENYSYSPLAQSSYLKKRTITGTGLAPYIENYSYHNTGDKLSA